MSDVPLDELGKWEAMPGDEGRGLGGRDGSGATTPVTEPSPASPFPQDPGLPLKEEQVEAPLASLPCPL